MMSKYRYSQLSLPTNIRLLRLLPSEKDTNILKCELFEYPLQLSDDPSHLYEALSYVWGSEDKPWSIIVDNQSLNITQNLHTALIRLQNYSLPRIMWVDAICIHQEDEIEKENQIPLMAEIYAKASRVVVWLGEAEDHDERALEAIRFAGEKSVRLPNANISQKEILRILQRQWFQRIWVKSKAFHVICIN
jgi:Heterokaryon incompatibility protein (HET)